MNGCRLNMDLVTHNTIYHSGVIDTLRSSSFFSHTNVNIMKKLASSVEVMTIPAGTLLFEKGEIGDSMYVVHSGEVKVHDGEMIFNHIGSGGTFGEMAVLDDDVRSASISAITQSVLLCINKNVLSDLISGTPDLSMSIICSLCSSMRNRVQDISDDYLNIHRLKTELKIGREIQSGFLPDKLPEIKGWQLADSFNAARECAGDFYDAFMVERNGNLAFIIGDVADKGVGAALFMTLFRSLLRASTNSEKYIKEDGFNSTNELNNLPRELISRSISITNNYISMTHGHSNMFATIFFGMINTDTGELNYVNCGHETLEIFGDGAIKGELGTTGPVVGLFPNAKYKVKTTFLDHGDILLGYTDGVTEAMNEMQEQYGIKRLRSYLCNSTQSISEILGGIEADIGKFTLGAAQSDDITMLALKRQARM